MKHAELIDGLLLKKNNLYKTKIYFIYINENSCIICIS